jgi:dienelactone hydrolase
MSLREGLYSYLNLVTPDLPVRYITLERTHLSCGERQLIRYPGSEGDSIPAYLFLPSAARIRGAILVHHQHNGERFLGKSEVSGLSGDRWQHFGPALCALGFVVLAPDSICFEDRRTNATGTEEQDEDADFLQHYNELCYRLLRGETLMKKVLEDSFLGINLLTGLPMVDPARIGVLGHSYGGNTVLFHSAVDERIQFSCSSGAAASYRHKMAVGTGIEMAEVIPGFVERFDIDDLIASICPRRLFLVSGTEDLYAADAPELYRTGLSHYKRVGMADRLTHLHHQGGHPLEEERFSAILDWLQRAADAIPPAKP